MSRFLIPELAGEAKLVPLSALGIEFHIASTRRRRDDAMSAEFDASSRSAARTDRSY